MNREGRLAGLVVFGLGIIILVFVFCIAYGMFTSPAGDLFLSERGTSISLDAAGLGRAVVLILVQIALLFVMTLSGSLIAGRGIQLYLGSEKPKSVERPEPDGDSTSKAYVRSRTKSPSLTPDQSE